MKTENTNQTALAQRDGGMTALELCNNMQSVNALGEMLAKSGFFGPVTPSAATAAVVNCFLEGLTPLQYKSKYHTFDNGQTGLKSDYIQREFHKFGGDWEFVEWTGEKCDMRFTYKGKTLPFCVALDEFKKNGVAMNRDGKTLKTNWAKFPREMLKARCMATAIRAICPEAMEGMYTQEEVADFDATPVAAAISPSPIAESPKAEPVDVNICPCGKTCKGKAWKDIPTETLEKILSTPAEKVPTLTADHRNAIIAELGRRETVEAEVVEG